MTDTGGIRTTPVRRPQPGGGGGDDRLGTVVRALSGNLDGEDLDAGAPPEGHPMSPLWTRLAAARTVLVV